MQCPAKLLVDRLKRGVWQRATPIRNAAGALAEANSAWERGYPGAFGTTRWIRATAVITRALGSPTAFQDRRTRT